MLNIVWTHREDDEVLLIGVESNFVGRGRSYQEWYIDRAGDWRFLSESFDTAF